MAEPLSDACLDEIDRRVLDGSVDAIVLELTARIRRDRQQFAIIADYAEARKHDSYARTRNERNVAWGAVVDMARRGAQ